MLRRWRECRDWIFIVRLLRCQLVRLRKYRRRTGVPREVERGLAAAGSDHARTWAYVHEPFRKFARQATLHAGACVPSGASRRARFLRTRACVYDAHARVYDMRARARARVYDAHVCARVCG